jgi:stringent starvation protein B
MGMNSMRPYLLRALHEWIVDNGFTPFLLVDTSDEKVEVPRQYIENGKIILNVSPMAVQGLTMDNDWVSFSARFSGRAFSVFIPVNSVLAIYAKENGKGMFFQAENSEETPTAEGDSPQPEPPPRRAKPVLRRVK